MSKSKFLKTFVERGFLFQCTNMEGLENFLNLEKKPCAYIGFDCTANTLHVGSLVQIMILRLLQKCGIKPLVLLGGATTKIGDPSGKDESRKMLSEEDINNNMIGIKRVLEQFITFGDSDSDAILVNNQDWFKDIGYIDFLGEIGHLFSINRMLTFESVKQRLANERNLTFLEFNYMILQAYDFAKLFDLYGCCLQLGGSDQWGNIVNGIELGRRLGKGKELFGLTTSLITNSSGKKMGKTATGAIWLTKEDLSPYEYWQFWRNVDDNDVIKFLYLFTDLSIEEIKELEKLEGSEINTAKTILANEACKICHGEEATALAEKTARETFENKGMGEDLPSVSLSIDRTKEGVSVFKVMQEANMVTSGKEARRLITGGGVRLNGEKIFDPDKVIYTTDFKNNILKLSAGKKKHAIIKILE